MDRQGTLGHPPGCPQPPAGTSHSRDRISAPRGGQEHTEHSVLRERLWAGGHRRKREPARTSCERCSLQEPGEVCLCLPEFPFQVSVHDTQPQGFRGHTPFTNAGQHARY